VPKPLHKNKVINPPKLRRVWDCLPPPSSSFLSLRDKNLVLWKSNQAFGTLIFSLCSPYQFWCLLTHPCLRRRSCASESFDPSSHVFREFVACWIVCVECNWKHEWNKNIDWCVRKGVRSSISWFRFPVREHWIEKMREWPLHT
jgi:hypothetical protein